MACFSLTIQLNSKATQAIFIAVNSVLFTFSVIGNSTVIYLVWSKAALRLPTYLLMSFLALSDLLTSLFGQLLFVISLIISKDDLSCFLNKASTFMNVANCTSSLLLLSLIARDRYLFLSTPRRYFEHTSNRFAAAASIASNLFGMIVASLITLDERNMKISGTIAFAVLVVSSFTFICLKSTQIKTIVKDHIRHMETNFQNTTELERIADKRSFTIEKSVNRSIFSIIILFFVSWTPIFVLAIILAVKRIQNASITYGYRVAFNWALTAVYLNSALNHLMYSYRCDAIGLEIRRTVAKVTRQARTAPSSIQQKALEKNSERNHDR